MCIRDRFELGLLPLAQLRLKGVGDEVRLPASDVDPLGSLHGVEVGTHLLTGSIEAVLEHLGSLADRAHLRRLADVRERESRRIAGEDAAQMSAPPRGEDFVGHQLIVLFEPLSSHLKDLVLGRRLDLQLVGGLDLLGLESLIEHL